MDRASVATALMRAFCERTGVIGDAPPRRYLWTDAFAVCNCLALHDHSGSAEWLTLADRLIDQVHSVLGRHRPDDERTGWISGLTGEEAARHPTAGGLRIGKPLPESGAEDPADDSAEWDRDGQYYHYLTRWVHALERTAAVTGSVERLRQAIELAARAHAAFAHDTRPGRQLYWKMSIDLSRPAVVEVGQHDALDGLVVAASLCERAQKRGQEPVLTRELAELAGMCARQRFATRDALGIGSLLTSGLQLARLQGREETHDLLPRVLHDAARSLRLAAMGRYMDGPADRRIAFRELGLAIGLAAVELLQQMRFDNRLPEDEAVIRSLDELLEHLYLGVRIESFWLHPEHQRIGTWLAHEDINAVMLATCLLPNGYLADTH